MLKCYEFSEGQQVTFQPYAQAHPMYVRRVDVPNITFGDNGSRVYYGLSRLSRGSITTITTGYSILESVLFQPLTAKQRAEFFK